MNFISVCSGIEAASVAWAPLGWRPLAFSEIEPFPCSLLKHHYPTVPNHGDMTTFHDWPDYAARLLCGGTPCQSFSVAGLRKGLDDPRGNLMLTYGAIAARYRPKWLVWENVPGVLSSDEGRDFGAFLGLLGFLGYGFAYRVLDAQYFGVPQRRRRVFVVGCLGNWRSAAAVLFERQSLQGHPAPSLSPRKRIAGRVACGTDSGSSDLTAFTAKDYGADAGEVAPTLRGGAHNNSHANGGVMPAIAFNARQDPDSWTERMGPIDTHGSTHGIAYCTKLHNTASNNAGKIFKERTTCLDANSPPPALLTAMQVRRLTPRECERLQGFPDDYSLVPHRGKPAADGPRYKALGNSWAVPCARWIGERIAMVEGIEP